MRMISVFAVLLVIPALRIPDASAHRVPAPAAECVPTPNVPQLNPPAFGAYAPSVYATDDAAARSDFVTAVLEGSDVLARRDVAAWASGEEASGKKRDYVPLLLSLLVPGAGELYMGYTWRGIGLLSLEVAAWTGYLYYHDQGLDSRASYEAFADAHWGIRRWIDDHPDLYPIFKGFTEEQMDSVGQVKSGSGSWPGYMPWVSKEEDKQHYYENIGKYDWFLSGWSDYDPDANPLMRDTAVRDQYRAMRGESNDQLDKANTFIYLSIGTRVFSIVETILLTRSLREDPQGQGTNGSRFSLRARPRGFTGGEIALEYRFR